MTLTSAAPRGSPPPPPAPVLHLGDSRGRAAPGRPRMIPSRGSASESMNGSGASCAVIRPGPGRAREPSSACAQTSGSSRSIHSVTSAGSTTRAPAPLPRVHQAHRTDPSALPPHAGARPRRPRRGRPPPTSRAAPAAPPPRARTHPAAPPRRAGVPVAPARRSDQARPRPAHRQRARAPSARRATRSTCSRRASSRKENRSSLCSNSQRGTLLARAANGAEGAASTRTAGRVAARSTYTGGANTNNSPSAAHDV